MELRRGDCVQVEAGRYPFPTVVGKGGTGGEWFESVRRALRWNNRGAVQKGFEGGADGRASRAASLSAASTAVGEDDEDNGCAELGEGDRDYDKEVEEEESEKWDIDADPIVMGGAFAAGLDVGLSSSEVSEGASPGGGGKGGV